MNYIPYIWRHPQLALYGLISLLIPSSEILIKKANQSYIINPILDPSWIRLLIKS